MKTVQVEGVRLRWEGDMVVQSWERHGRYETEALAVWREAVCKGGVAIDVGAYTGLYSIAAALAGADRVIAVEPNAVATARLRHNIQMNRKKNFGRIIIHEEAAWAARGIVEMRGPAPSLTSALSAIGRLKDPVRWSSTALPLDSLKLNDVVALKIDAERAEYNVLVGARKTLRAFRPIVLVEDLGDMYGRQATEFLTEYDYRPEELGERMVLWSPK